MEKDGVEKVEEENQESEIVLRAPERFKGQSLKKRIMGL